jgi:hypothetical protein
MARAAAMNLLPFRTKKAIVTPEEAEREKLQGVADETLAFYEKRGVKLKDRNVSKVLIRATESAEVFRILCLDCIEQFDVTGALRPADAFGDCPIIVKLLEHMGRCSDRKNPKETLVLQNRNTPEFFVLSVTWEDKDRKPGVTVG